MGQKYIKKDVVQAALESLRSAAIHSHFAGYLCVKKGYRDHPNLPVQSKEFKIFFDTYLAVAEAPLGKPYVRIFTEGNPSATKWINSNVAGSYAPSSIRPDKPLGNVIKVVGKGNNAEYQLVPDSAAAALSHLLNGARISPLDLATFLYRDYSFDELTRPVDLVHIFTDEFGFSAVNSHGKEEFDTLFYMDDADKLGSIMFDNL